MIYILFVSTIFIEYGHSALLENSSAPEYKWAGCENLGKCKLDGFSKPPLVILSFDGFAREYLERRIVKSLEFISECGVKADRVFPSFPSKTFPNHYTMVTGLYPESHGITDNNVFDLKLSPNLTAMSSNKSEIFYNGEPIWSAYKRLTGKSAHCLFWVGCYFNNTGYKPDVSPDYNQSLPLQERIDTINEALEEVDKYLDVLLGTLHDEGLLECINLVIISDHGMQPLNKTINIDDYINTEGLVLSKGVVARIHLNRTDRTVDDVSAQLRCKIDGVKVNTVRDIPLRKHYSKSSRVGDIIIEGQPGTTFYNQTGGGDHGYDYYNENMHTIMFARGPSFRPNVTVPPYQNVQYMNLWLSLLGLEGAVENNGTIGFFDSILKNPPVRENNWNTIEECPDFGSADVLPCGKGGKEDWKKLSAHLESCVYSQSLPIHSTNYCYQSYCENSLIVSKNEKDSRKAIIEILTSSTQQKKTSSLDENFSFVNSKYSAECPEIQNNESFFTAGSETISKMAHAQYSFPDLFLKNVLFPLSEKTAEYLDRFGKLFVMSGLATDSNLDGISDSDSSGLVSAPTHFYRILITCTGGWLSTNPPLCKKYNEMKVLAFVFPILNEKTAMDCMHSDDVLLDYTATVQDVERIAGFQCQIGALSHQQNVYIRRNITTSFW
ncbi:hypothetical protein GCK72_018199 [Caenorhabditis remanei]|uniref:Extracellular Endonuclease subunit A domain-containing protein n=1 Tax=Caenorhabditis remanei TaxID=31234 RepID=A0A6A5GAI1_CAERE|nr:hypothetical protein GCK72_018199 [Caenorhabditis remanei]KAF1751645.1 hypothetical protein GCK72_018199 [Caenorhabditis remanei]